MWTMCMLRKESIQDLCGWMIDLLSHHWQMVREFVIVITGRTCAKMNTAYAIPIIDSNL
jgi:hypothetical protein